MSAAPNRRAGRRLAPRGNARVTCRRGAFDLGANLAQRMLDVSQTGAQLVLHEELPTGHEVSVCLEAGASGKRVLRVANVAWCRVDAAGGFRVGLRFQKPIGYGEMDHFARI